MGNQNLVGEGKARVHLPVGNSNLELYSSSESDSDDDEEEGGRRR